MLGLGFGGGGDLGGWRGDDRLMCPFGYLVTDDVPRRFVSQRGDVVLRRQES